MKIKLTKIITAALAVSALAIAGYAAFAPTLSASGHGTFIVENSGNGSVRRQFSFSARRDPDGTVRGNAVLTNPAFDGDHGQNYQLQVDIQCMNTDGNIVFFGGTTRRTNDPNLVDAVYWSVQDNGNPGAGNDLMSDVFFFDNDPATTGDPQLCLNNRMGDFPMQPIEAGNITVRAQ